MVNGQWSESIGTQVTRGPTPGIFVALGKVTEPARCWKRCRGVCRAIEIRGVFSLDSARYIDLTAPEHNAMKAETYFLLIIDQGDRNSIFNPANPC